MKRRGSRSRSDGYHNIVSRSGDKVLNRLGGDFSVVTTNENPVQTARVACAHHAVAAVETMKIQLIKALSQFDHPGSVKTRIDSVW